MSASDNIETIERELTRLRRLLHHRSSVRDQATRNDPFGLFTAGLASSGDGAAIAAASERLPTTPPLLPRLWAVWVLNFKTSLRGDRLGLFWWFAEPALGIILITFASLLFQGHAVHNMPTFPFALLGVLVWMSFRTTFLAVTSGLGMLTLILHEPSLNRFDIILGRSFRGLVSNLCVGSAILCWLVVDGVIGPPENPTVVLSMLLVAAVIGFGVGLTGSYLALFYPGIRRLYLALLRFWGVTAGLFYVSEQLPPQFKPFFLWNPILHAVQIARDGYFTTYTTQDASLGYLLAVMLGVTTLGLAFAVMERRARARRGETA